MPDTMAFMFESNYLVRLSDYAQKNNDKNYVKCWHELKNHHAEFLKK